MDGEELQIDSTSAAVGMSKLHDARPDGSVDAEFFFQFPFQSLLRAFAGFDLAAGEFPFEGHGLVGAALTDEHLPIAEDKGCGYEANLLVANRESVLYLVVIHSLYSRLCRGMPGSLSVTNAATPSKNCPAASLGFGGGFGMEDGPS